MAIDALAIPFDITWQRLGYMADMVERGYESTTLPPKWRSSATIYGYVVPESETTEDYPDHRVLYLKVSTSITGWSPREVLSGYLRIRDDDPMDPDGNDDEPGSGDPVQDDAQSTISGSRALARNYWPCVAAIAQVAVYPRPEVGVADDDYPYIADFEPKKRELYEAVSATNEVLSGSHENTNVRKGSTSTTSNEVKASAEVGLPLLGSTSISASRRWGSEDVNIKTTDASTERRETAGRSTQLSQMYQLFNGYHCGTNRAVFVMFPRPHMVSESAQIENSLINGDRRLEGVQDLFLIVQVPKTNPGFCVRVLLDLSHKTEGHAVGRLPYTTTRRRVSGCATFAADRLVPVRSAPLPPSVPRIEVIDEGMVDGSHVGDIGQMKTGRAARIGFADDYNVANAQLQRTLLGTAASSGYRPRPFEETSTFYNLAKLELVRSKVTLAQLESSGYLESGELKELIEAGVTAMGELFLDPKGGANGTVPKVVGAVRARIWASIVAKTKSA